MSITTTTTKGYGSRIMDSIKGILIGFGLFFASFFILYINEGSIDLSKIIVSSIESEEGTVNEGQFISKSGKFYSKEKVGDNQFIKEGGYLSIERKTEMFSWLENKKTETTENYGGSETTTTTYTYKKEWKESIESSEYFIEKGHDNPTKKIESSKNKVNEGYIDNYSFSLNGLRLPNGTALNINKGILIKEEGEPLSKIEIFKNKMKAKREGVEYIPLKTEGEFKFPYNPNYIFVGSGSLDSPQVGDIRISYKVLNNNTFGTIFGKVEGNNIIKYVHNEESSIFHLFDKDREGSIEELHNEYLTSLWLLRLIGFLMMWIGLMLILNIFSTFLAVIPFLAKAGRFIIALATFVIAIVLSLVTILIGIIAHNIFILIGTIVLLIIGVIVYLKNIRVKK